MGSEMCIRDRGWTLVLVRDLRVGAGLTCWGGTYVLERDLRVGVIHPVGATDNAEDGGASYGVLVSTEHALYVG